MASSESTVGNVESNRRERISIVVAVVALLISIGAAIVGLYQWKDARQVQRSYVGVENANRSGEWTAVIKAIGPTPALHVTAFLRVADIDDDAPVEPALKESQTVDNSEFPFFKNALFLPGAVKEIPLEKAKPVNFKPHKIRIYFGTINYVDIFSQRHVTHFCIRLGDLCDVGNEAE
jgi:hypothetical protein